MTVPADERDPAKTCNTDGCDAWATEQSNRTRCRNHGGESTGAPEGNKNAVDHGLYSALDDPHGLYGLLRRIEGEDAIEWVLWKTQEYSRQVSFEVFEIQPSPDDSREELSGKLTGLGEDLLNLAVKVYMTRRGEKRAIAEGIVTQVEKVKGKETVKVQDVNPVMKALDMLERQVSREKKDFGITDDPESQKADAVSDLGQAMEEAFEE